MSYRLVADATREFSTAIEYYENIHPGLALQFLDDFDHIVQNVVAFPDAWAQVTPALRRCLFRRFPNAILYSIKNDTILVAAVMHLHKDTEEFFKQNK